MHEVLQETKRRLPIGAEVVDGRVHFRVWAPRRIQVEVVFESSDRRLRLGVENNGYFSGFAHDVAVGTRYRFKLDNEENFYPDPASRFQPRGPHGPSQVVDPSQFDWTDQDWPGIGPMNQVLYELHIGTFTKEGTWEPASRELPALKELGVTCLEVMPVAEFPGKFGWGYDGVDLFAPTHLYGAPDDFRRFVNRAHEHGIGVILDVVYNHFGPDGNYLTQFSKDYFTEKHKSDWGAGINFDDRNSQGVREFFLSNAQYWIEEFHLDGFRFDATQAIIDTSSRHILADITERARQAAGNRQIYLINENEPQDTRLVGSVDRGGYGMDALWNDDFHHSAMVVLSGRNEAYYTDYLGTPQEFISSAKWNYLYQGQRYKWQEKRRGTPALDLPPTSFVNYIQNHDQIANTADCLRAHEHSGLALYKAMSALLLLLPQTPMLFQGQEWATNKRFCYFADHNDELRKLIHEGRIRELSQFASAATPEISQCIADPGDPKTFENCKLDHDERQRYGHAEIFRMYKELLRLRREEAVFRRVQRRGDLDGAVLGPSAFVLRFFAERHDDDRLLLVNFGVDLNLSIAPEPLLAPPSDRRWATQFSTEDPRYLGHGTPSLETENEGWLLPGRCTVLLQPLPTHEAQVATRVVKSGAAGS